MKNCPYCNAEIDDNSLFCGICGKKLPANQFCVKCGNKRNGIEKFCPKCGTPYDSSHEPKDDFIKETGHNSKSKNSLWIAIVTGLIIVLLGGCIWYFTLRKDYSLEGLAKAVQKYEIISNFKDGLAEVCKDGKWGFIDKNGNEVIPCKYNPIEDSDHGFFEGLAVVMTNNNEKSHVIDKQGNIAFTHSYSWVSNFSEGLSVVSKNDKMGYIDTNGKEVIPCTYDLAYDFSEGMAIVYKGNKYGFIDTKGNVVIPFEYETDEEIPTGFHDGLACVCKNGKYGYIDKKGNVVVPYKYDIAYPFSEGMAVVAKKVANDVYRYGYIDTSGNEVIKCEYRDANSFSEGYASVKKVADYMFIDKNGKEMFSCSYYNVGSFHEGLARVTTKTDDNFLSGFIDKSGNEIIPCIYDCYEDFSEGLVVVSKDGINGYVDKKGNSTFDVQNEDVQKVVQEKIEERKEEERAEEERKRIEERRKGVEKVVTLSFTRPEQGWDRNLSCTGNYGAIITDRPKQYAVTEYIEIPSGKIWIYESCRRIEGDPRPIRLWYYSRESGALHDRLNYYDSEYLIKEGGIPILRPGDGFRISFNPFNDEGTKSVEVYFKEKDEEFAY